MAGAALRTLRKRSQHKIGERIRFGFGWTCFFKARASDNAAWRLIARRSKADREAGHRDRDADFRWRHSGTAYL